mgnify:CR=1 FL=1|jgi:hypothetical protein
MPRATTKLIDGLTVQIAWEAILARHSNPAEDGGTGLIMSNTLPPTETRIDPMGVELHAIAIYPNTMFEVPRDAKVSPATHVVVGAYDLLKIGRRDFGIIVHCLYERTASQQQVVVGDLVVCLRSRWYVDAETGEPKGAKTYTLEVNLLPAAATDASPEHRLLLPLDTAHEAYSRNDDDKVLAGGVDGDGVAEWATCTNDWNPDQGVGGNQHFGITKVGEGEQSDSDWGAYYFGEHEGQPAA